MIPFYIHSYKPLAKIPCYIQEEFLLIREHVTQVVLTEGGHLEFKENDTG